jgi:hypothetical protein
LLPVAQTTESGNYGALIARCALSDAKKNYTWLARMVRTAAIVSAETGHDWPRLAGLAWRARTMMYNNAMPRGCRPAELYEHNLDPPFTPNPMHTCIPILQLFTDSLVFRHFLRSCLNNASPGMQERWRVQAVLPQHSPICHTLAHMGT